MPSGRRRAWGTAFLVVLLVPAPAGAQQVTPSSPKEPFAKEYSPANAAAYLDGVAVKWLQKHNCGSCHTGERTLCRPQSNDCPAARTCVPQTVQDFPNDWFYICQ